MQRRTPEQRPTASQALLDASKILGAGFSCDNALPSYWTCTDGQTAAREPVACGEDKLLQWPIGTTTLSQLEFALEQTSHAQCLQHLFGGAQPTIVNIERLENPVLWRRYCLARESVASRGLAPAIEPPVRQEHPIIDAACNEFWLWHGTRRDKLDAILREGLDEHVSQLTGLYGAGVYFSDEACKVLQYTDEGDRRCLLYCRVTLGRPYYTQNTLKSLRTLKKLPEMFQRGELSRKPDADGHDSVIANPGPITGHPCKQVHREFIVFQGALSYPEFVVSVSCGQNNSSSGCEFPPA